MKKTLQWTEAVFAALLFAIAVLVVACSRGGQTPAAPEVPNLGPAAETATLSAAEKWGGLKFAPPVLTVIIENANRADFFLELWDKAEYGTGRPGDGTPLVTFGPFGNGTYTVDLSQFACYDMQADLGSRDGGLLRSKQLYAWGPCPVNPPNRPPKDVCPNLEGVQ